MQKQYDRKEVKEYGRTVARLRDNKRSSFAELFNAVVKVCPFTVKEIAEAINTSPASVNKWKAGQVYPAAHYILRFCLLLHGNQNKDWFFEYTERINRERI